MNPVEIEMNFPAEHGGNVFGQFDAYMKKIEKTLHVSLILRGDHLKCIGTQQAVNHAISVIDELLELSKRGNVIILFLIASTYFCCPKVFGLTALPWIV